LRDSRLKEDSRSWLRVALTKYRPKRIRKEIHGYSLVRILIFGLILPAIMTVFMMTGIVLAFWFKLNLLMKFMVLTLSTLAGFAIGTLTLLRLRNQMLRFAKIRRQ
jgi:hypothetical protein